MVLAVVIFVGLFGRFLTDGSLYVADGLPFAPPSSAHWLGTDTVGRDVLTRVLYGGQSVLILAFLTVAIAYAIGLPVGLACAYSRGRVSSLVMRAVDLILAFPPMLVLLLFAATRGEGATTVVLAVAVGNLPGVSRIVYSAAVGVMSEDFVEAAQLRRESVRSILRREVLPNIAPTLAADIGIRMTLSILLIAAANFLGLGIQPPTADWGLMMAENRDGLLSNPWAVVAPAILIAALTVSFNIFADSLRQNERLRLVDSETPFGADLELARSEVGK